MGAAMARNVATDLDTTVWNRTMDKARPLADAGATVSSDPGEAVGDADVIVTMLFDVDSVAEVMAQALPYTKPGAVWVQTSTVGIDGTARLAELAGQHDIDFVDAPVLGTKQPAEQGALIILAAGPPRLREACAPVFDAIGSRTVWVGDTPGAGHRLKLVANSWVLSLVGATAQAIGLARDMDIDPQRFLDAISGGPLDSGYAQLKGAAMIEGEFSPAFTLDGAVKDSGLIIEAMRASGTDETLMAALHQQFQAAAGAGHGAADMAAVIAGMGGNKPPS